MRLLRFDIVDSSCINQTMNIDENNFASALIRAMEKKGITGKQLAQAVGLSENSISKLVTGKAKPRRKTQQLIAEYLYYDDERGRYSLANYQIESTKAADGSKSTSENSIEADLEPRVRLQMKDRVQGLIFKDVVQAALDRTKICYTRDYYDHLVACDFLCQPEDADLAKAIALFCKYDPVSNWHETILTASIAKQEIGCEHVLVVCPYLSHNAHSEKRRLNEHVVEVVPLAKLDDFLLIR